MNFDSKFERALEKFDAANGADPNKETVDGIGQPHELVDAQRLHTWVLKLDPEAGEALQLASRCQHIERWKFPRNTYPMTRAGYLKWRTDLKKFHAERAAEILREVGYDDEVIRSVQSLNLKKDLSSNPDAQTLEDALCLTFLEFEFAEFAKRTEEAKTIGILQKTWAKMSEQAHAEALKLSFDPPSRALIEKALRNA